MTAAELKSYEAQYDTPGGIVHVDIPARSDRHAKLLAGKMAPADWNRIWLWSKPPLVRGMRFVSSRTRGDLWKGFTADKYDYRYGDYRHTRRR